MDIYKATDDELAAELDGLKLGPVEIHREFMTAAAIWIMAATL